MLVVIYLYNFQVTEITDWHLYNALSILINLFFACHLVLKKNNLYKNFLSLFLCEHLTLHCEQNLPPGIMI